MADTAMTAAEKTAAADTAGITAGTQKSRRDKFSDENGDGIDDRLARRGKGMQGGRDKFIDADGDGICDGREAGIGFHRGSGVGGKKQQHRGGR